MNLHPCSPLQNYMIRRCFIGVHDRIVNIEFRTICITSHIYKFISNSDFQMLNVHFIGWNVRIISHLKRMILNSRSDECHFEYNTLWVLMRGDIDWNAIRLLEMTPASRCRSAQLPASVARKWRHSTYWQRTIHVAFWVLAQSGARVVRPTVREATFRTLWLVRNA